MSHHIVIRPCEWCGGCMSADTGDHDGHAYCAVCRMPASYLDDEDWITTWQRFCAVVATIGAAAQLAPGAGLPCGAIKIVAERDQWGSPTWHLVTPEGRSIATFSTTFEDASWLAEEYDALRDAEMHPDHWEDQ